VRVALPPRVYFIPVSVFVITEHDCAGGDSIRIFSTPASGQNITDFFCFETAYVFGDTSFTATGQYLLTDDCGTTDTLNLIELPRLPVLSTVFSLCRGDSIRINGRWYVAPDTAVDTFTSVNGCDSFFVSNLDVFLTARTSETRAICANDSVQIGDRWYQAPATVTDTFPDVNGCDSFHTIELTLLAEDVFRQDTLRICAGDSIFLAGDWQTEADIYRDSFIAVAGCDSIIQTTLLVDVALDFELSTRFLACPAPDGEIGYLLIRNLTSLSSLTVNDTPVLLRDSVPLFPAERYALSLVDVNGCSRDTVINRADTDPEGNLAVSLPNLIRLNLGDSIQLTPELFGGADSLRYAWMPSEGLSCSDCATPWARPIVTTAYTLRVTDATGCTDTSLVRIVVDADAPVYVPTAFSPNADGMNDRLVVGFSAAVSRVERFEIYDRWGGVLYALTDLNPTEASSWGWNGESRGRPAVVGVYVWKMELRLASGQRRLLAGEVLLLR
ncbi:MAG: gliding motility-associated C-terminal domain-containing protein, partial [Bacteroidota bacterium]